MPKEIFYRNQNVEESNRLAVRGLVEARRVALAPVLDNNLNMPEENQNLAISTLLVKQELASLGLNGNVPLPENHDLHLLKEGEFAKIRKIISLPEDVLGVNIPGLHKIIILRGPKPEEDLVTLFHEVVHYASFESVGADWRNIVGFRSGYALPHRDFSGFNEGVVQKVVAELITQNQDRFPQLREAYDVKNLVNEPYKEEQNVVEGIVNTVSKYRGEPPEEVWRRIKRGLFTGHIVHLKDVERAFGEEALFLLSLYGNVDEGSPSYNQRINTYLAIFFTCPEEERPEVDKQLKVYL